MERYRRPRRSVAITARSAATSAGASPTARCSIWDLVSIWIPGSTREAGSAERTGGSLSTGNGLTPHELETSFISPSKPSGKGRCDVKLSPLVALGACVFALTLSFTTRAQAQTPMQIPGLPAGMTPEQMVQLLAQNPQLAAQLRHRIEQSGMTPDQIRAQLTANGYPAYLLDAYLGGSQSGEATQPSGQMLAALQALGIGVPTLSSGFLPVDTGFIRERVQALPAESLAAGNYVFGVDVFRRTTTQFLPLLSGPVPPDYKVGPGDQLAVILTGDIERAYVLPVSRDGFILIPQVGQIFVSSLTLDQLRDVLYARLGRVYSKLSRAPTATTHFAVEVTNVRINQVSVVGEVMQPGSYQISARGTRLRRECGGGPVDHPSHTAPHPAASRSDAPGGAQPRADRRQAEQSRQCV